MAAGVEHTPETRQPRPQIAQRPVPARVPRAESNGNGASGELPKGERTVLIAIAQYPEGAERDQLTVLTGYKRSTRDAYIQRLSEKGFVIANSGAPIVATQEGIDALGSDYEPLPTGEELQNYWLNKLPEGERKILAILLDANGNSVNRDDIAERTGYARSSRDAYLQRLSSRRLVEQVGRGEVKASGNLFAA
jgi:DNA-binding MarR family transcriptional regulator